MSNDHKELFNLVNLLGVCPKIFGNRKTFMDVYRKPIRQSRYDFLECFVSTIKFNQYDN